MLTLIYKGQSIIKKLRAVSLLPNLSGFVLIEVILSAALLLIIVTFVVPAYLYGEESVMLSGERQRAALYAEEGLEALRNVRDANFNNLVVGGPYGLAASSGAWTLNGSSDTNGEFTRQILIGNAGTDRLIATSTVTWSQNIQRNGNLSLVTYLHNWAKVNASDITIIGSASNPADNGTLAGPTVAVAPPPGLQNEDLIILIANYRGYGTLAISEAGGQTWTTFTQATNTSNTSRIFYAIYNGTWTANPSVTVGSGNLALTVVMHVLRNVNPSTVLDVTQVASGFNSPAAPRDVTISGINTITDSSLVLAVWASGDDNTWRMQTTGWANLDLTQYRNLSGSDSSISTAYKIISPAGASGDVTNRQIQVGGDNGTRHILAFRRKN